MRWHAFDLDGTLAIHNPGDSIDHIGAPIAPMVDLLKSLLNNNEKCKILTARACSNQPKENRKHQIELVQAWCFIHIGEVLEVTAEKDFHMIDLHDDRAISVERNTGNITTRNRTCLM